MRRLLLGVIVAAMLAGLGATVTAAVLWWYPDHCYDGRRVFVFPEGHAWQSRRSTLLLFNPTTWPITVVYDSPSFLHRRLTVTLAAEERLPIPVADLVPMGTSFSVLVWSNGPVAPELISWDPGYVYGLSSPVTTFCRASD